MSAITAALRELLAWQARAIAAETQLDALAAHQTNRKEI